MDLSYLIGFSFSSLLTGLLTEIWYLLIRLLGIKIIKKEMINYEDPLVINLKSAYSTQRINENMAGGLICGKWFVGYGENQPWRNHISYTLYYIGDTLTRLNLYDKDKHLILYRDESNILIKNLQLKPNQNQQFIIQNINNLYAKKNYVVAFINGTPGAGKSKVGILLTDHFKSTIHTDFNPLDTKNDLSRFARIYRKVNPSKSRPLIILIDEIDELLFTKVYPKTGEKDEEGYFIIDKTQKPTLTLGGDIKRTWNKFLDEIDSQFYENIIFIMTSNKTKKEFDDIDSSLLRKGRIDIIFNVDKNQTTIEAN